MQAQTARLIKEKMEDKDNVGLFHGVSVTVRSPVRLTVLSTQAERQLLAKEVACCAWATD